MKIQRKIQTMRISHTAFILTLLCSPSVGFAGQSAASAAPGQNAPTQSVPKPDAPKPDAAAAQTGNAAPHPSGMLQPSLDALEQAAGAVKLEKWKGGPARAEAGPYISSILRDLQSTLPPLLKEADAAPNTMSKVLPVSRNVDALYDVLLRVVDGARGAAPAEQVTQLDQAMTGLLKARHTLDDRVEEIAAAGEKHLIDVQGSLVKAQAAAVCPVAPAPVTPPPPPAAKKRVVKKKPAAPATTPPAKTPPAGTAKPNS
jgi:hypothetical protein